MGDRITTYNDCPKCKSKGTFECYEALSSLMKFDECAECGYNVRYDVNDTDNVITIERIADIKARGDVPE